MLTTALKSVQISEDNVLFFYKNIKLVGIQKIFQSEVKIV